MTQRLIIIDEGYDMLEAYLKTLACQRVMLVHGKSMSKLRIGKFLLQLPDRIGIELIEFSDYESNPRLESALHGAALFQREKCDCLFVCGGGSAIDVAKCIRLFIEVDTTAADFLQHLQPGTVPFVAIPTTAGTGSEATHFAVVYKKGEKLSIAEPANIPQAVVFDPAVLTALPWQQKYATFLDAICHAIESMWSLQATDTSRLYAGEALRLLCAIEKQYLQHDCSTAIRLAMFMAAHYAGKAINQSKTTAAHAMCYKLTSSYGLPHGIAAALCLVQLWKYMEERMPAEAFAVIYTAMGCASTAEAIAYLEKVVQSSGIGQLKVNEDSSHIDNVVKRLAVSVNRERLKNHPLKMEIKDFAELYRNILIDLIRKDGKE